MGYLNVIVLLTTKITYIHFTNIDIRGVNFFSINEFAGQEELSNSPELMFVLKLEIIIRQKLLLIPL